MQPFIPDQLDEAAAATRVTHLGIGAHQDDLEFMAYHGIEACFRRDDLWFGGVTCTNGAGSSRTGPYAGFSDEDMQAVRHREQEHAAVTGEYAIQYQLGHPSSVVKDPADPTLSDQLLKILRATTPDVVYTHNPADKHPTHLGVTAATLKALRRLSPDERPKQILGCEVWRGLDWMNDADKVALDVSRRPNLAAALGGVFDSQIAGGKRYDLAVEGRRRANATFFDSHAVDATDQLWFAMDLTPLIMDDTLEPVQFTLDHIRKFEDDVRTNWGAHFG